MLKGYYLTKEDTGERVLVGYKVKDLAELEAIGYRVSRTAIEDFTKARKKGTVYIGKREYDAGERIALLFNSKGIMIASATKMKGGEKS